MNFLGFLSKPLGWLLETLYGFIGNYGISIIILTVVIKFALYPSYKKQILSSTKMMKLQPEIKRIQAKYPNDKMKQQQEMQKFYQEHDISSMGGVGCVPMLIQMIVIMGLFSLLRQPMSYMSETMITAVHESFLWMPDLGQPDSWIMPISAAALTFVSSSISQMGSQNPDQGKGVQMVMRIFLPLMILWLARSYPSGLAVYWLVGQVVQIGFNLRFNKLKKAEMAHK